MKHRILILAALALATLPVCLTPSCTSDPQFKERAGQASKAALADVFKAVSKTAFDEMTANGDQPDPGHAAAEGLWTELLWKAGKNLIGAGFVQHQVSAWSGQQLPQTAQEAAKQFAKAAPASLTDQKQIVATIAAAISQAALAVPK